MENNPSYEKFASIMNQTLDPSHHTHGMRAEFDRNPAHNTRKIEGSAREYAGKRYDEFYERWHHEIDEQAFGQRINP